MIKEDELLFVVDENNQPLTPKPRNVVHREGDWHRAAHVWIMNDKKQLLCGQRSMLKDTGPGIWEPLFGGHVNPNIEFDSTAVVELEEELGIKIKKEELKLFEVFKNEKSKEFQALYLLHWNGDIKDITFEKEEVEQVKWIDLSEIKKTVILENSPQWSHHGYIPNMVSWLENM